MRISGIISALTLLATPAISAELQQQLDAISVTATRIERQNSEVPASIAVIGQEAIKDTKMFNLKEALSGTPGVLIDTKNQGYDARMIIRGAGLKARYGIRDIMVLLDGVPVTDPDSFTRLDFIDTQLIERIEVVKGPNSTLWGANAAGGVVNIISKDPLKEQGGTVKVGLGTESTANLHISYSGDVRENLLYSLSGSRRQSDNSWRRWNEFNTTQFAFQPTYIMDDSATWSSRISYSDANLQLPGSLNDSMFKRYLDSGKAPETDGPWQYSGRYSDTIYVSSKISKEIGNLEIVPLLYFNHWTHNHPVTGRINDAETNSFGADLQMNYSHSIDEKTGVLTSGITLRYDDQATDYFKYADIATSMGRSGPTIRQVLSDTKGSLLEKNTRETWLLGIYAQESLRPFQDWLVDAGVRYDMVDFNIKSAMYGDYNWGTGNYIDYSSPRPVQVDRSYNAISPRLGVSWALQPDLHLFTNVSTGVQTPTEGELSENPSLDLVKVQNYEAGVKTQGENWSIDSAVYYSPVEDEVVSVVDGFSTSYINAGKTIKKGLEVSGVLQMSFGLSLTANYSYTDYTFDEFSEPVRRGPAVTDVDRSGNYLPYIPTHQYALSASYRHPSGFKSKIQSQTWGEYYMDNANTEKYEGYEFITSLMLGYETGPWDFTVNIDNLFDKQYATEVTKDTSGERQYNPAAPLSLMARLNYRF